MRGTVLYGPRDVRFEDRESHRLLRHDMAAKAVGPAAGDEATDPESAGSIPDPR